MEKELNWLIGLDSINKSIIKWKEIVHHQGKDEGIWNCALCTEYHDDEGDCLYCPIKLKENIGVCTNTPYVKWFNYQQKVLWRDIDETDSAQVEDKESLALANLELSYLYEVRLWWINQMNRRM